MPKIELSTADFRSCTVDKMKALFHRWEDKSWIVPPSPMVGGHSGGEVRGVFAIVEMEDGTIREVEPTQINFGDSKKLFEVFMTGKGTTDCPVCGKKYDKFGLPRYCAACGTEFDCYFDPFSDKVRLFSEASKNE